MSKKTILIILTFILLYIAVSVAVFFFFRYLNRSDKKESDAPASTPISSPEGIPSGLPVSTYQSFDGFFPISFILDSLQNKKIILNSQSEMNFEITRVNSSAYKLETPEIHLYIFSTTGIRDDFREYIPEHLIIDGTKFGTNVYRVKTTLEELNYQSNFNQNYDSNNSYYYYTSNFGTNTLCNTRSTDTSCGNQEITKEGQSFGIYCLITNTDKLSFCDSFVREIEFRVE
jgi:type III secretory pathway component EscV